MQPDTVQDFRTSDALTSAVGGTAGCDPIGRRGVSGACSVARWEHVPTQRRVIADGRAGFIGPSLTVAEDKEDKETQEESHLHLFHTLSWK